MTDDVAIAAGPDAGLAVSEDGALNVLPVGRTDGSVAILRRTAAVTG